MNIPLRPMHCIPTLNHISSRLSAIASLARRLCFERDKFDRPFLSCPTIEVRFVEFRYSYTALLFLYALDYLAVFFCLSPGYGLAYLPSCSVIFVIKTIGKQAGYEGLW
jgi:hypothetical protein